MLAERSQEWRSLLYFSPAMFDLRRGESGFGILTLGGWRCMYGVHGPGTERRRKKVTGEEDATFWGPGSVRAVVSSRLLCRHGMVYRMLYGGVGEEVRQ